MHSFILSSVLAALKALAPNGPSVPLDLLMLVALALIGLGTVLLLVARHMDAASSRDNPDTPGTADRGSSLSAGRKSLPQVARRERRVLIDPRRESLDRPSMTGKSQQRQQG